MQINKDIKRLLKKFRELKPPLNQYAIFGAGPMTIRGIRKSKDLDVIVTDDLYKKLLKRYKETKSGQIKIGKIEIFSPQSALIDNPEELIDRAETIQGFKFIRLDDLIKWKKKLGRKKDLEDIELIKDYLAENKNL